MLRKIIDTQHHEMLTLELPEDLQGKRIEVIAFAIEEEAAAENKPVTMSEFFGTLSPENAEILFQHTKQARSEWERDF